MLSTGTDGNDILTTGSDNDTLYGGLGKDSLDGGIGNDTMYGGAGDDIYVVDSIGDVVTEASGEGYDFVKSSVNYTLGDNVEKLQLTGSATIGTGNALDNYLIGSGGNDILYGGDGNDSIWGYLGFDTLYGGNGNDTLDGGLQGSGTTLEQMYGGLGDDTFIVDNVNDRANEDANQGTDTVQSSITFTLTANLENLTLTGTLAINGTGNTLNNVITGNDGNNSLFGADGNDLLYGGLGNDTLDGGAGNDTVYAGDGNESLFGGNGADLLDGGPGNDSLYAGIDNDTLDGGDGNDLLSADDGNDLLYGGSGIDTVDGGAGDDTLIGGDGNDTYLVDSIGDVVTEMDGGGTDTVKSSISYTLGNFVEKLMLTGTDSLSGTGNALDNAIYGNDSNNLLSGGDGNDSLYGGAGNDMLVGAKGDDYLHGGNGNDTLIGGIGNDGYVINSIGDVIVENDGEGTDYVLSSLFSYTLASNFENLQLLWETSIYGTGNALNNLIYGQIMDNVLDGGTGDDTLYGGSGNDTYMVDSVGDIVDDEQIIGSFRDVGGTDIVLSSVTFTLSQYIENLTLTGSANLNGTGNALNNGITGNSGDNVLDGGTGNDTMIGGAGNDTYVVDSANDVVTELDEVGTDTVQSSISFTLGDFVENLTLTGNGSLSGTGNALNNVITGNSGDNVLGGGDGNDTLNGGAGNDTLIGGAGNDTYVVDSIGDVVTELDEVGTDTVQSSISYSLGAYVENLTLTGNASLSGTGNALNNVITGNIGNNALDGGAGDDQMAGGDGDDSYVVDSINDTVTEGFLEGRDLVKSSVTYTLGDFVESLMLTGSDAINGTGNDERNDIAGNSSDNALYGKDDNDTLSGGAGNDLLDGGEGNDLLRGGDGDDTFVVDSSTDDLIENAGEGKDTVQSAITFTLLTNFENLTLTGTKNLSGTGNVVANAITGNDGNNNLSGDAGNDTLVGGAGHDRLDGGADADQMAGGIGDDTYVVDATADSVSEDNDAGTDTVQSSIDYELRDNFENLVLTGTDALSGTGNALDNAITGNDADNVLSGGAGSDTLKGGKGDDTYIVTDAFDTIVETASSDLDTVQSTVDYTLGDNLETLVLTGNDALIGKGNELANTITGNAADDTLSGLGGDDTLYGNDGNDYLFGGDFTDALYGGDGTDVLNGGLGTDIMAGGDGDDTYFVERSTDRVIETGSTGHDIIYSSINFTLDALFEDLTLMGTKALKGTGNDLDNIMTGNAGNNFISGNDGADTLNGNDGADTLNGGAGADQLDGGTGADRLVGGDGNDTYFVDDVADVVVENLVKGSDWVKASVSYTLLANIEVLELAGDGPINGTGNAMNNKVIGNSGENVLKGLVGSDTLDGGDGNDILIGGAGNDILIGGVGADSFVFERTSGSDHITDFTAGDDHVNLAAALVNYLGGINKLTEASFYAATYAVTGHDADDRLIYNTTTGALYYDVDGSGKKAAVLIATLDLVDANVPALHYSDFTFG